MTEPATCAFGEERPDGTRHECPLPATKFFEIAAVWTKIGFCEQHGILFGFEQEGADKAVYTVTEARDVAASYSIAEPTGVGDA